MISINQQVYHTVIEHYPTVLFGVIIEMFFVSIHITSREKKLFVD